MGQTGAAKVQSIQDATIGVVRARYNKKITSELEKGCLDRLRQLGASDAAIRRVEVPGAVELALAAKWLTDAGCDGVVCIGCVIRGDTAHFDYVCQAATWGITEVSLSAGRPVIFCVLTTDNERQAWDRVGGIAGHKGVEAADTLAEMLALGRNMAKRT